MKITKSIYALMMFAGILAFSACGSDDDSYTFETPQYENISAKYTATSNASSINSLELTASGNYIIIKNNGYNINSSKVTRELANNILMNDAVIATTRSASYGNIIYGKFTKIDENIYDLEGYGVVTITTTGEEAYKLFIELDNGTTISVGARKQEQYDTSAATDKLCRSWNIAKLGLKVVIQGRTFNKMVNADELDVLFHSFIEWVCNQAGYNINDIPAEEREYLEQMVANLVDTYEEVKPLSMIFTKSGSYMVHYANAALGVSTWKWEDENAGLLRYSWNSNDIYDENLSGVVNVSYSGSMLLVAEETVQDGMTLTLTYGMTENFNE